MSVCNFPHFGARSHQNEVRPCRERVSLHVALEGERRGTGGHRGVTPDWLIGGDVYIVYLCPAWRNSPPTVEPPQQTCNYRLCFERPCYYADTPALPLRRTHFSIGSVGIPNKWTDVQQDGGNCQNKLMNCKGFASLS